MEGPISSGNYLVILVRNRELGKVKTRLAKTVGKKAALTIYQKLLERTMEVALKVQSFRVVYYSNFVDFDDLFNPYYFYKDEQNGADLGERMHNAIADSFNEGAEKVVCIGSDCYELTKEVIDDAFEKLSMHDVVFGPAADGGYYLIGMKKDTPKLFVNKEWGSSDVLLDSILTAKENNLSYALLPTLNDIDREEDLPPELRTLLQ